MERDLQEKLDQLTERHEALVQTVEYLSLQSEEQNKRLDKIVGALESLVRIVQAQRSNGGADGNA